jgi:hypothetical protein
LLPHDPATRHSSPNTHFWIVHMLFWLTLAAATAWLVWYVVKVPGVSYTGPLKPLSDDEKLIAGNLRGHVEAIASREHNVFRSAELEASARYIEKTFVRLGYTVAPSLPTRVRQSGWHNLDACPRADRGSSADAGGRSGARSQPLS